MITPLQPISAERRLFLKEQCAKIKTCVQTRRSAVRLAFDDYCSIILFAFGVAGAVAAGETVFSMINNTSLTFDYSRELAATYSVAPMAYAPMALIAGLVNRRQATRQIKQLVSEIKNTRRANSPSP